MKNKNLLKSLNALGFPMLENEQAEDANSALAGVVKSKTLRLCEGFPVVLANSAEKGIFDYNAARKLLHKTSDKSDFDSLILMSLTLYKALNLRFSWSGKLYKDLPQEYKMKFNSFLEKFKTNSDFNLAQCNMSADRLKSAFANYFSHSQKGLSDLFSVKDELGLEYALSQIFSPKQKELFLKKLRGEKLTKTEKEYFSRTVKKKVLALANVELHRLSQKVLSF